MEEAIHAIIRLIRYNTIICIHFVIHLRKVFCTSLQKIQISLQEFKFPLNEFGGKGTLAQSKHLTRQPPPPQSMSTNISMSVMNVDDDDDGQAYR